MNAETAATGTMPRLCIMALVALVLLAFGSSLFNTFVIDDEYILLNNYAIRRLGNLPLVFTGEYFTAFAEQSYRPVCTLSYILDYQLFTLRPLGYHLHNVLLHTLNAVLVFAIARGMLGNLTGSFLTAGLFAVHTISGEAVNGIGFREDLQVVLLMLAACWACLRWCDHPRPVWIAVVWLASFLCVITKENGIVMPILLAGVLAAKRGRRFWKGAGVLCAGALLAWGASVAIRFVFMTFPAGAGDRAGVLADSARALFAQLECPLAGQSRA
ncbi:glycosyltransferase family 39 protein, partial [Candidatus Poribacteria bacterium]|nr:glycosyltransferase family 39 protein [Candidatus Poribacteria bacterium]